MARHAKLQSLSRLFWIKLEKLHGEQLPIHDKAFIFDRKSKQLYTNTIVRYNLWFYVNVCPTY